MQNLNDSIYDYQNYTVYKDRNHDEFVVNDAEIEKKLLSYEDCETKIISDIINHKASIYLRFCDGEFLYYKNIKLVDYLKSVYRWLRWMNKTCRWEKTDLKLLNQHFEFFANSNSQTKDINFFPHVSNSYINQFKSSKLRDYLKENDIKFGHFYYIYHFLNKLRQWKIKELENIKIVYIDNQKYHDKLDYIYIPMWYSQAEADKLWQIDFTSYDLILLGWWISSPLWAKSINKYSCPIIDSGYMISTWSKAEDNIWDRAFTSKL